ncbi:hypothetical protein [Saccharopolyspora hattusasensis]|uniref:hypothetical protein n=1 Tax=Saccharopolyspora hattusasensis TaxID=1128679 RepID=UPI003D980556
MITLVLSVLFGGGAGALTALLIGKNGNNAQRPAQFPPPGFAPQPPHQQYPPQQFPPQQQYPPQHFPPQQGYGQPLQDPQPPQ